MIPLIRDALNATRKVHARHPATAVDELLDALLDLHNTVEGLTECAPESSVATDGSASETIGNIDAGVSGGTTAT